jgi:hypothetical protein
MDTYAHGTAGTVYGIHHPTCMAHTLPPVYQPEPAALALLVCPSCLSWIMLATTPFYSQPMMPVHGLHADAVCWMQEFPSPRACQYAPDHCH